MISNEKKSIVKFLVVIIFVIGLMGCGRKEEQSGTLAIYYLKNHSYYGTALGEFYSMNHTKYDMKLVPFESEEAMNSQLTTEFAAGTGPDVVLTTAGSELDIYKSIKSGNIEELSTYLNNDKSYHEEDYYMSIIKGGNQWGGQYIIPFTYGLDVLYLDKETLNDVGYTENDVKDYGTMVELLSLLEDLTEKDKLSTFAVNHSYIPKDMVGRHIENSGLKILNENSKLELDVHSIQILMRYIKQIQGEYKEKLDGLMQQPDFIFDYALSVSSNGNYPVSLLMLRSILDELYGKECIAFPWKNVNGEFQPFISEYGFINKNSNNKGVAYILLRYLMDYEVPISLNYPLSVNRINVEEELSMLQKKEMLALELKKGDKIMSKLLDDEATTEIKEVLDNMGTAVIGNTGYYKIVSNHIYEYLDNGDLDLECENIEKKLQRYLDE